MRHGRHPRARPRTTPPAPRPLHAPCPPAHPSDNLHSMTVTTTPMHAPPDRHDQPVGGAQQALQCRPSQKSSGARRLGIASLIAFLVLGRLSHLAMLRRDPRAAAAFNIATIAWLALAAVALALAVHEWRAVRTAPRTAAGTTLLGLLPLALLAAGLVATVVSNR
jgi:hypothetical protein